MNTLNFDDLYKVAEQEKIYGLKEPVEKEITIPPKHFWDGKTFRTIFLCPLCGKEVIIKNFNYTACHKLGESGYVDFAFCDCGYKWAKFGKYTSSGWQAYF